MYLQMNVVLTWLNRYLYLTEISLSLVQQHVRNNTECIGSSVDDIDLRAVFPRLEWLSVEMRNTSEKHKRFHIHVELHLSRSQCCTLDADRLGWIRTITASVC